MHQLELIIASVRFEVMVAGDGSSSAVLFDGVVGVTTTIEDIPGDVLSLVLRRLDGASLAAIGCACSGFRELAADVEMWRARCLEMWPSVRDIACVCGGGSGGGGYRALFADAFPFPAGTSVAGSASSGSLPAQLVSAVDLHHNGFCVMSRVVETDTSSEWFLVSPFRVDALVQEGFSAPAPITPAELTLSWILIDPSTGRAVNASSRRPVSVDRRWLTGETVARFSVVLGGGVALDAAVTCDDRHGHVREVSLRAEDGESSSVSGRDGLAAVTAAMEGARQGRGAGEEAVRRRYEAFARARTARRGRKARRDGVVDICCSGVAVAALLGLLSTLILR